MKIPSLSPSSGNPGRVVGHMYTEPEMRAIGRFIMAFFGWSTGLFLSYGLWRVETSREAAKQARQDREQEKERRRGS
jgi:hypothetical protein